MESPNSIAGRHPSITLGWPNGQPFADCDDGRGMAQAVVDALREPVLLLDRELRVLAANQAYCLVRSGPTGRTSRAARSGPSTTAAGTHPRCGRCSREYGPGSPSRPP